MQRTNLFFISIIFFTSSIISAFTEEWKIFHLNMIRFSKLIVVGQVMEIQEIKESRNAVYEVVNVLVKEKITGKANKSIILLKYAKSLNWTKHINLLLQTISPKEEMFV